MNNFYDSLLYLPNRLGLCHFNYEERKVHKILKNQKTVMLLWCPDDAREEDKIEFYRAVTIIQEARKCDAFIHATCKEEANFDIIKDSAVLCILRGCP